MNTQSQPTQSTYFILRKREETLLRKMNYYKDELYAVRNALKSFPTGYDVITLKPSDKKQLGTKWKERCIRCITLNDRLMRTAEILECAMGKIKDKHKRDKMIITIGTALNTLVKEGKLKKKIIAGEKGHLFGTLEMFNNNEPKSEYMT
jgi:hypothetical protein